MVLLDEFLNNHEAALQLAAEARKGGCDHVLIDFGEATTRYRCGDNARAIEAVQRAELRVPCRDLPIEQVFALTYALRGRVDAVRTRRVKACALSSRSQSRPKKCAGSSETKALDRWLH
jgi:hypothetical protein